MGPRRKKPRPKKEVHIDYPPVPTKKWIPPDKRAKKKPPPKYVKPPGVNIKLEISSLKKVWHAFKTVGKYVLLLGDYCQSHHRYHYTLCGLQGPANCTIAILYAKLYDTASWDRYTLNKILDLGSCYFAECKRVNKDKKVIKIDDLLKEFFVKKRKFTVDYTRPKSKGYLYQEPESAQDYLLNVIKSFFSENTAGIVVIQGETPAYFAVWKYGRCYFLFDPSGHDEKCYPWTGKPGGGTCCLIGFPETEKLVHIIQLNSGTGNRNAPFEICPVEIDRLVNINTKYPDCMTDTKLEQLDPKLSRKEQPPEKLPKEAEEPAREPELDMDDDDEDDQAGEEAPVEEAVLTSSSPKIEQSRQLPEAKNKKRDLVEKPRVEQVVYYNPIVPDRSGILLADMYIGDKNFERCVVGVTYTLAAFVMLREHRGIEWTTKILNNVLRLGYRICMETSKLLPVGETITVKNVTKKITLNERIYTPVIREYGAIGYLSSMDDKILDLLPALKEILSEWDTVILQGPLTVAVWKEDDKFFLFDPNERDPNGLAIVKEVKVGSVMEAVDYISGVACAVWFSNLKDLVSMYLKNIERSQRREKFILSPVEIEDHVEAPENWMKFIGLEPGRWILRGNFSQSDRKFPRSTRNTQCTCNAAMALMFTQLVPITEWDTDTIDKILMEGNEYYKDCVKDLMKKDKFNDPMLMVVELLPDYVVDNKLVNIEIDECLVNGVLVEPPNYPQAVNLKKGLIEFFKENDYGILTCKGLSIAIFRKGDAFFYFDSHDRNNKGFYKHHGKACVQRMTCIDKLSDCITPNFGPSITSAVYNISRIGVNVYEANEDAEPDEDDEPPLIDFDLEEEEVDRSELLKDRFNIAVPLEGFTKITKKRAILRSSIDQGDETFGTNAGKQTIANLMAAIGMSRLFDPKVWTVQILDDVLKTGDRVYDKSMNSYYKAQAKMNLREGEDEDENDDITFENVEKTFKIGVNKFAVEFEQVGEGTLGETGDELKEAIETIYKPDKVDDDDCRELVVHTDLLDVIVWKQGKLFYLFDPKRRDERGDLYGKDEWSIVMPEPEDIYPEYPEDEGEGEEEEIVQNITDIAADEETPQTDGFDIQQFLEKEWHKYGHQEEEESLPPPKPKHPPEYWDEQEKLNGKAYIMRSTKLKMLIKHIINNTPPKLREGADYILTQVRLMNVPELKDVYDPEQGPKEDDITGDWYNFQEITRGEWILRGLMHQKNEIFPEYNRGKQSISNCLLALGFAAAYPMAKFSKYTVDSILKYGDRLYTKTKLLRREDLVQTPDLGLSPAEIDEVIKNDHYTIAQFIKKFCVGNEEITASVDENYMSGEVHAQELEGKLDVLRALENFFLEKNNKFLVLESKGVCVAIWRMTIFYYMFDPCDRGPHGYGSENGVSCITRYVEIQPLVSLFLKNLPSTKNNFFYVHRVLLIVNTCNKIEKVELRCIEPPEKIIGFTQLMPGKSIVRGTIHQEQLGRGTNAQCSPIAFVALAMTLLHHVEFWTKPIINNIIREGDRIYGNALDNFDFDFNPWEEKMTVSLAPNDFKLGKIKVNCELRSTEQRGIIDIKDPNIQNLRQGIERFFDENSYGVIETDFLTVAIWEGEDEANSNHVYMFDPNCRGPAGMPVEEEGVSCALKFLDARMAAEHIIALVDPNRDGPYLITPVEIVVEKDGKKKKTKRYGMDKKREKPQDKNDQKVGRCVFYKVPNTEFELLRGTKSQNWYLYSGHSRGNQDVPNCIVAFVMNRLIPLEKWNYKTIDMILDVGDQLYKDSYMVYNPKQFKLRLETLIRDVIIKDCRVKISVGSPVMMGLFSAKYVMESLTTCFNQKSFCIILVDDWAVSIFKRDESYCIFHPFDLDLKGNRVLSKGHATMLRFPYLDNLVQHLVTNAYLYQTQITGIGVRQAESKTKTSSNSQQVSGSKEPRIEIESTPVFNIIVVAIKEIEKVPTGTTFFEKHPNIIRPAPEINTCDRMLYGHLKHDKHRKNAKNQETKNQQDKAIESTSNK